MPSSIIVNPEHEAFLDIQQSEELVFDVEWWADEDETEAVDLASCRGGVKASWLEDEPALLDFADYFEVADNRVSVRVPQSVTVELPVMSRVVWDFTVITVDGEEETVARGTGRIRQSVG